MIRPRFFVLPLAAGLLAGVAGTAGAASWQRPPFDVTTFPQPADDPQLTAAPSGSVLYTWEGWTGGNWRIQARSRGPQGGLTRTLNLSPAGVNAEDPRIAIAPDGTSNVIWKNMRNWNRRVQIRTRRPGGAFGATQTLSGAGADATEDRVVAGPQGQTAVAWAFGQSGRRRLQFRERPAGGSFEPVRTLSGTGSGEVDPEIAYAPDGTVTVVWELASARESIVYGRIRRPGQPFGPIIPLSAPNGRATDVMIGVDPTTGVSTVVWERVGDGGVRIQARTVTVDGELGPVQDLSGISRHASDADIAVAPDGTTTVLWEIDFTRRDMKVTQASTRAAGATEWGPVVTLTRRAGSAARDATAPDVDDPVIAVTPDGTFAAVWKQNSALGVRVQERVLPPGGTWAAPQWLSAPQREADEPRITASPQGVFSVVWKLATGVKVYPEQNFGLQGIQTRRG